MEESVGVAAVGITNERVLLSKLLFENNVVIKHTEMMIRRLGIGRKGSVDEDIAIGKVRSCRRKLRKSSTRKIENIHKTHTRELWNLVCKIRKTGPNNKSVEA